MSELIPRISTVPRFQMIRNPLQNCEIFPPAQICVDLSQRPTLLRGLVSARSD